MSTLLTGLGFYTYERYLKTFEHWAQNLQTSSPGASEKLVEYTRLNWVRTQRLHKTIELIPELKTGMRKIQHYYTWMVITEAWCGDSAQNIPVIAEIAGLNPEKIKLLIVLREENPELMNNYLTNGTRSVPKLIAIDETMNMEAWVWGPRPAPAQQLLKNWKRYPNGKSWTDFEKELHSWYARDKTQTIQAEFLNLLKGMS